MCKTIAHNAPLRSGGPARLRALTGLLGLAIGAVIVNAPANAASVVPSEAFCQYGCDLPEMDSLMPNREIPLPSNNNPLRLIAPLQDYIGELEDDNKDIDSGSEWRNPQAPGPRIQN